jgi:thiol-disulfide isomerase/thioredoxin
MTTNVDIDDYDIPLTETLKMNDSTSSSSWRAVVETISTKGYLVNNTHREATPCSSLKELLTTSSTPTETTTPARLLLVLVSGSWCTPCRNFTPVLAAACESSKEVKVLWCSADHDYPSFQSYYQKMPATWSSLVYDEDEDDERDDLLEALNANSLPTLIVFDPLTGTLLNGNAVLEVQAAGKDEFSTLVEKWKTMIQKGQSLASVAAVMNETRSIHDSDTTDPYALHYYIPSPPGLICQYFKERLLSPDLPEALAQVIYRRETLDEENDNDLASIQLIDSIVPTSHEQERWMFRTAAPALPTNWYGSTLMSLLVEATAVECWQIERSSDDEEDYKSITKAVCTIENETARLALVFRETIKMEITEDGLATNVTKTLNLDSVPSVAHSAFQRRWKTESELIFHALLGTCDRRKKS